ncbi:hypothetical protein PQ460_22580 [Paenibacillus sp. KACC 21273]|uniref:hypothetical protein n=1 Tax=Paenibacillus sp. KACC 21273 TaxID=3025665 RepID=UPI002366EC14|nr:hypothetical protein [Paenibacillus sp. KACC 21273]WDF50723.1 hypothetical protein PQ460_22580 [Paenibacillus sp. KACC 21273]
MFNIQLILKNVSSTNRVSIMDSSFEMELDDPIAILIDICEVFEISESIVFLVSGFGQEQWPVDCRTDLLTVIEQIPFILKKISKNDFSFQLDFYEQGIEHLLIFEEENNQVRVSCVSHTDWTPDEAIYIEKDKVLMMFEHFYYHFLKSSQILCPTLADHILLNDWKKGWK